MKIRLKRSWFAPSNPLQRNSIETSSGRRLRKFHSYAVPDSWESILPTDGSVERLPDDAVIDEVIGVDYVSADNTLHDMDEVRAAAEAIPQDDDVVPEYVKKRNQKASADKTVDA